MIVYGATHRANIYSRNIIFDYELGRDAGIYTFMPVQLRQTQWADPTPGPMLINSARVFVRGEIIVEYLLDAYIVTYGEIDVEYILGFIVEAICASTVDAVSTATANAQFNTNVFSSTVDAVSSFADQKKVDVEVASKIDVIGAMSALAQYFATMASFLTVVNGFTIDGIEYDVYALNADTFAVSKYAKFNYTSFAECNGRYYAANATGLYEIGADNDAGVDINASIILRREDFDSSRVKRVLRAYLNGTSDGALQLRVITDTGAIRTYTARQPMGAISRTVTVRDMARGTSGHQWQFEVRNQAGDAFELNSFDVYAVLLSRRIKP